MRMRFNYFNFFFVFTIQYSTNTDSIITLNTSRKKKFYSMKTMTTLHFYTQKTSHIVKLSIEYRKCKENGSDVYSC